MDQTKDAHPYGLGTKVVVGGLVACAALTAIALAMPNEEAVLPVDTERPATYEFATTTTTTNVISVTRTGVDMRWITSINLTDSKVTRSQSQIPVGSSPLDVTTVPLAETDLYEFAEVLMGAFKTSKPERRGDLMRALSACEYYGSVYLPSPLSVGDIHGSWAMTPVFLVSSSIIPFERIDAEENLYPDYAPQIRAAYAKYSNSALRFARGVARTALTVPTVPLNAVYLPVLMMAMRNMT
jgi:hypothetical protein